MATSSPDNELVSVQLKTLVKLASAATLIAPKYQTIRSSQNGGYLSHLKGRGMEFDETRVYQPGDDIRSIDWRVTARSQKTHTKIYREERERPVYISVDYRPAMIFATRGVFKSVQAAKIAAILAWSAIRQGDRVGGQVFNDKACQELKPKGGKQAVLHFLNALVSPAFKRDNSFSLEQVLARLVQHAKPGSLVYLISDFRGLNDQSEIHLSRLKKHCELVLIHIYDPIEKNLPSKGRFRFTDGLRDRVIDTRKQSTQEQYLSRFKTHQQHLQTICKKWRLGLLTCTTQDNPVELLR